MSTDMIPWLILLLSVLIAIEFAMLIGLTYLVVDIQRRLGPDFGAIKPNDSLEDGAVVPDFAGTEARTRGRVSLADFADRRLVMAFLAPSCGPCKRLVPSLNRLARERRDVPVIVVLTEPNGSPSMVAQFSQRVWVVEDEDKHLAQAYHAGRTPLVYLIDEERKVVTRTVSNNLIDLEDTLAGLGRPQGGAVWVEGGPGGLNGSDGTDMTTNQEQETDQK